MIHVYCGDGKGKTTAAFGLAFRAAGRGMNVVILQFLKSGETGEITAAERFDNITVLRGKEGNVFSFSMTEEQKTKSRKIHMENLRKAIELTECGQCDLLVLDEAASACRHDLLERETLRDFVERFPESSELVITGRNPEDWMTTAADYVTEMKKHKHPYDRGVAARVGIEK